MELKDKEVIALIEKHGLWSVWSRIEDFPENEVYGRSDMDIFKKELEYALYSFECEGYALNESLSLARMILKETKYGKAIPVWEESGNPIYRNSDITSAKETINEYHRTKRMAEKLEIKVI